MFCSTRHLTNPPKNTPLLHHITSSLCMTLFTCFSISWEFGMPNWRLSLECPSSEEFCSQKNCFIHNLCIHVNNYNQFSYILGHTDNVYIPGTQTDWLNMHVLYLPFWLHTTTRICCYRIVSNSGVIYMSTILSNNGVIYMSTILSNNGVIYIYHT